MWTSASEWLKLFWSFPPSPAKKENNRTSQRKGRRKWVLGVKFNGDTQRQSEKRQGWKDNDAIKGGARNTGPVKRGKNGLKASSNIMYFDLSIPQGYIVSFDGSPKPNSHERSKFICFHKIPLTTWLFRKFRSILELFMQLRDWQWKMLAVILMTSWPGIDTWHSRIPYWVRASRTSLGHRILSRGRAILFFSGLYSSIVLGAHLQRAGQM